MAIVVSHIADDFGVLAERALRQAPLADLIEIRLDRIGDPGGEALRGFIARSPKPVIVACHGPEAFGEFRGSVDERLGILRTAAEAGARFVDVDWRLSLDLGEVPAPCHRIVSRHDPEGTPDDLEHFTEEVREVLYEGDVTKIVPLARTCEEAMALLAWLRTTKGVVAFSAGEAGSFTRLLAPVFGSPFTYCAPAEMDTGGQAGEATAPGQLRVNDLRAVLPPVGASQETAILGVVGRPARYSLSPWVHGMALKAARLDAVYVAFEPETLEGFLELARDENFRGFSVTAPFKEAACALAAVREEACERTGAANTLVRERDGWRAANTDVAAVRDLLERALAFHAGRGEDGGAGDAPGGRLAAARVLVLGAGGAARAAVWAARALGAAVTVAGRTAARAEALAGELGCASVPWDEIPHVEHDVLVHATPAGSRAAPGQLAIPAEWIRPDSIVLDAVYRPIRTPLLLAARERGCTPVPGGEWFVRQAAAQFRLFTGAEPDEELLRKAFEHAGEIDA